MILSLQKEWEERKRLLAEGDKIVAEGDKLRAKGAKLWVEAILEKFGNIEIKWEWIPEKADGRCALENGEVYEP